MSHRIVAALVCACLAIAVAGVAHAQPRRGPQRPGNGAIVGRVFDAATNTPIRRAQIQGSNNELFVDALSDDQGRFQLTNLPQGEWRVTVSKGGYFTSQPGQRRPFDPPPPIKLGRGARLSADVHLSRGGVITGRVSDDAGEPLAGLRVRVYRAKMVGGYRQLEDVGAADQTDDTGAYRIFGLPPGDYYVAASLRMAPPDSVVQTTYSPTYYPGTGELAQAQRIRVDLGTESTAIFPLLPVRSVNVTGTVLTSSGGPANAFLNLVSDAAEFGTPLGIGGVTQPDGTFTIPDVPPGRYMLNASLRGDGPAETGTMPLTVINDDVTGNTIVTGRPATLKGRFVADTGVVSALPDALLVATAARPGGKVLASGSGRTFELDELSEPFMLHVEYLPDGWGVKSIVVNGMAVTDAKVELTANQEAEVQVVLTNHITRITGVVSADGQPVKAEVVVFAADSAKWSYPSRFVRTVSADEKGRFRINGLPAAERYLVVATDYLEDGEHNDPEFLERMRDTAIPILLEGTDAHPLELKVVAR
jgi:Carboxypeptidase regulatory-like domain